MSRTCRAKKHWFNWLCEHSDASSGRGGSLSGMRKQFWGESAFVVRCCDYLFKVSENVFYYIRGFE